MFISADHQVEDSPRTYQTFSLGLARHLTPRTPTVHRHPSQTMRRLFFFLLQASLTCYTYSFLTIRVANIEQSVALSNNKNHEKEGLHQESSSSPSSSSSGENATQEGTKGQLKCPDCDLCDGSGRIAGGIGAVIPWIPIKAYRPCPNFLQTGQAYQRSGQALDEIAFGRDKDFKKTN